MFIEHLQYAGSGLVTGTMWYKDTSPCLYGVAQSRAEMVSLDTANILGQALLAIGTVPGIAGWLVASLASTHQMPEAPTNNVSRHCQMSPQRQTCPH